MVKKKSKSKQTNKTKHKQSCIQRVLWFVSKEIGFKEAWENFVRMDIFILIMVLAI